MSLKEFLEEQDAAFDVSELTPEEAMAKTMGLVMMKVGMLESLVLGKISKPTYIEHNAPVDSMMIKLGPIKGDS